MCSDLNVEVVPKTLICNIHPLIMFQINVKELYQNIHDTIGRNKINGYFLVEFSKESFVIKAFKCLSNFTSRNYSAKTWNRSSHFEELIKPKINLSVSLKDHRSNYLQDCCSSILFNLMTYHII